MRAENPKTHPPPHWYHQLHSSWSPSDNWKRCQELLTGDSDSVSQGTELLLLCGLEDGICSLLEWRAGGFFLRDDLVCADRVRTMQGIVEMVRSLTGHPLRQSLESGEMDGLFLSAGNVDFSSLSDDMQKLLVRVSSQEVLCPAGEFMMGSEDGGNREKPAHKAVLTRSFYLSRFLVTQALVESVMGENPSKFKGASRPAECVSWYDTVRFCNALSEKEGLPLVYTIHGENVKADFSATGYRLPTEAEWEYAAKAGTSLEYAGSDDPDEVAWYRKNSERKTHPVGQKKANAWGLYDMSGNVLEWVWDWYGEYESSKSADYIGVSEGSYRVLRGGGWPYDPNGMRASYRYFFNPDVRYSNIGARLCRLAP